MMIEKIRSAEMDRALLQSQVLADRLARLKQEIIKSDVIGLKGYCYLTRHAAFGCIMLDFNGRSQMLYWDEVEADNYGININPKPHHLKFKECWKIINKLALDVRPGRSEPVRKEFRSVPASWYLKEAIQSVLERCDSGELCCDLSGRFAAKYFFIAVHNNVGYPHKVACIERSSRKLISLKPGAYPSRTSAPLHFTLRPVPGGKLSPLYGLRSLFVDIEAVRNLVGARVVQKLEDFELRLDDRAVDLKNFIYVFRVERIEGDSLFLKAERNPVWGWAGVDRVVPIEQALEYFDIEARARPLDPFPRMMLARVRRDRKDYDQAIAEFTEAIRLDSQDTRSLVGRACTWRDLREYDNAITDCSEAIRLDPNWLPAFVIRAAVWCEKREYDKAIADCSEAIRLDPKEEAAFTGRGYAWSQKREYDKAIADFSEAINLDPSSAYTIGNRGFAWFAKKEYDKSIADLAEAIRLDPTEAKAFAIRGNVWLAMNDYDKAIADCSEAVRLDPTLAYTHAVRGSVWLAKKEYEKTIADCSEAIRLSSRYQYSYEVRAAAWFAKKEYDKAIADCGEAIRLDPEDGYAYRLCGDAWFEKSEYAKAVANYNDVIRIYPNDMVVHFRRAAAFVLMLSFWWKILFGAIALGAVVSFVSWVFGVI
jgi:tetratricopeptide (TPR) repeat protein